MAGLCEGGNKPLGFLIVIYVTRAVGDNTGEMSPGSGTESYPAFACIGLRENPGKNLNQVPCPDQDSNPGHLVSQPEALTVTPQVRQKGDAFPFVRESAEWWRNCNTLRKQECHQNLQAFELEWLRAPDRYGSPVQANLLQIKCCISVIDV
ncbi:hypothetical protein ANN_16942 [Periplaneta americana]|uniref:Uncharacterized protein n=1 Tax=Periplaneta americana TaxID=6978 RepID=A0ABQ8SRI1_PERAM|nr:hypothetical protein ANN_16942 [Periplaneta americana]